MSDPKSSSQDENHKGQVPDGNSRREFLRKSAMGLGGAVAAGATGHAFSAQTTSISDVKIPSINIAEAFTQSLAEDPKPGKFEGRGMSGAQVFAQLCKEEELAALFCCPGNYTVINALAAAGIPSYGGRSEGAMCSMADGFSRATG